MFHNLEEIYNAVTYSTGSNVGFLGTTWYILLKPLQRWYRDFCLSSSG